MTCGSKSFHNEWIMPNHLHLLEKTDAAERRPNQSYEQKKIVVSRFHC